MYMWIYMCIHFPPKASAQWQPDGLTVLTKKTFLGAGLPEHQTMSYCSSHDWCYYYYYH